MPVIGDMSDLADIHPIPHMSPISDIGDKMGNWYEGDICEIHDSPDFCEEEGNWCGMVNDANPDESDIVCGIHAFSGECDELCHARVKAAIEEYLA